MKGPLDINSLNSARPAAGGRTMTLRRRGQRERERERQSQSPNNGSSGNSEIPERKAVDRPKGEGRDQTLHSRRRPPSNCALAESSLAYMCRQDKWEADNAGREIRHA